MFMLHAGLMIGIGVFAAVVLAMVVITATVLVGIIVISRRDTHKRLQGSYDQRQTTKFTYFNV